MPILKVCVCFEKLFLELYDTWHRLLHSICGKKEKERKNDRQGKIILITGPLTNSSEFRFP